jgi:hypothetical protein
MTLLCVDPKVWGTIYFMSPSHSVCPVQNMFKCSRATEQQPFRPKYLGPVSFQNHIESLTSKALNIDTK